jgi:hypothetical protein
MFLSKTSRMVANTTGDREPWPSLSTFDADSVSAMHVGSRIEDGAASLAGLVNQGSAVRRVLYTGSMAKSDATGLTPAIVTLDTSIDWRNRALLVSCIGSGSATAIPFASSSVVDAGPGVTRVFLTGSGAVANAAAQGARQLLCGSSNPEYWLWADSTTGHLKAEMKTISTNAYAHGFLMVMATPTLGFPSGATMTSVPIAAPAVYAADLNRAQNFGVYAQGRSNGTAEITCPPLGVITDGGLPARPISWLVRERRGDAADRSVDVRQHLYGQRKRVISLGVATGATIDVDAHNQTPSAASSNLDQIDYRDRLLRIEVAFSSTWISIESPNADSGVTRFTWFLYTGPFGNQSVTVSNVTLTFEFGRVSANAFHSRLRITNATGADVYANIMIEASGFLGLTDRRLDAQSA